MQSDLVSVIIPAYNAASFIKECVDSVLNQTYKNLEIIVVNDGSTDQTELILKSYNDKRLRIISQKNKGCSAAKNKGLEFVNGKFVQYLDADDILSYEKIEFQVKALKDNNNNIAVCKTVVFKYNILDSNEEIDTDLILKEGSGMEFLLRLWGLDGKIGMVQPNAYLIPTDIIKAIGKWDEELSKSPAEDGEYFSRVLIASKNVKYTKGINYYRKLTNVASVSKGSTFENAVGLFITIKKSFSHLLILDHSKESINLYTIHLTNCAYQFGNQYPKIYKLIEEEFKKYNIHKYIVTNNTNFAIVTNAIGFKNAMVLRKLLLKINI
jgi:glycosyltransferase involved in cell wall biosynthesis